MVISMEESLLNVARSAFTKGQPVFRFIGSNGKIIGMVENLPELVTILPQVHPVILHHHMTKEATHGIFEYQKEGRSTDILGIPIPISDLPMWILYVLGDTDLAETLIHLVQTIDDSAILKNKVTEACRDREKFLLTQIAKTNQ